MNKNNYCVILAGGRGRRLWPYSREKHPKQFVDIFGTGRTQLQSTYDRFCKILPKENIFICTNMDFAGLVKEQLPDIPEYNMIYEPVNRNTAPCVAWAVMKINVINENACVIITPSDELVVNEEAFIENVSEGLATVATDDIMLTLGVPPSRPEPGYGYIQLGETYGNNGIYKVQSFTEKPEREFAKMFMESGEFYWNTGLMLGNIRAFRKCFRQLFPQTISMLTEINPEYTSQDMVDFIGNNYSIYPNMTIDNGILEKCSDVYVMRCNFGWADLGTWHAIYECQSHSPEDNVVLDSEVMLEDCKNNVIKLPKGKLAVINGLDGYIVTEKDNVLFICKKGDSSALVRKYVNEVQMKYGDEFV